LKEQALQIARQTPDSREARNRLREYLQHVILREIFELNGGRFLVFHGGTALRIVHGLRRFSEDLDFHTSTGTERDKVRTIMEKIPKRLHRNGYALTVKSDLTKTVHSMELRFEELLQETGLSVHSNQKLNVKIEIDTTPPVGFGTSRSIINTYFPFALLHHDQPTFLAGKINAVLTRAYSKGRDYYDLFFYLSRWKEILPNFPFLKAALLQANYHGEEMAAGNWKQVLLQHIQLQKMDDIRKDLSPFIENPAEMDLITLDNFRNLLTS